MKKIILSLILILLLGVNISCLKTDITNVGASGNITFEWHKQERLTTKMLSEVGINFTNITFSVNSIIIEFAEIPTNEILAKIDIMLPNYIRKGENSLAEKISQLEDRVEALEEEK